MPQPLHVHLLPTLILPGSLQDGTAVIIDILRASSTILTALHNGASRVVPCGTPLEATQVKERSAPGTVLLGGERGGVRIPGFDLGNSPAEYQPDVVTGRTVAFTTTNGTRALLAASSARQILIGAFLNRQALLERLDREHQPTHLICAGTDGVITGDDVFFAGSIVDGLRLRALQDKSRNADWILNDSAMIALAYWRQSMPLNQNDNNSEADSEQSRIDRHVLSCGIRSELKRSLGGQNLASLGYDSDISLCSQLDTINTVYRYLAEHSAVIDES